MTQANLAGHPLRVLGLLTGDITNPTSDARIKYGQLFRALADRGVVHVCDVELRGIDRYQNALRTIRWPADRWRQAFYKNAWGFQQRSRRASALARRYRDRADVILQHGALFNTDSGPGGPPVVIYADFTYRLAQRNDHWRNPFADTAQSERWNELEAGALGRAAFVLTRSEYTRRSMIADYGIPSERVAVVGGGINFAQLPAEAEHVPQPRVLFVGQEFERKGGRALVAAFALVRERIPDAELWLVTAETAIAGPGIRRIAPTYDRAELAELYRSSAVFAMPSRGETWGDVFLEAMAYGLPCIGTTSNAMPEIIEHGVTGYLVDDGDVEGLATYLERLLRTPALRRAMGDRGRERVLGNFTWQHVVQRMMPYLDQAQSERLHALGTQMRSVGSAGT